jgi:hypothetical protein
MPNKNSKNIIIGLLAIIVVALIYIGIILTPHNQQTKPFIQKKELPQLQPGQTPFEDFAMEEFFQNLNEKQYDRAIPSYDGLYNQFRDWNPTVSYYDLGTLWKNACEMNGLNCLRVKDIVKKEIVTPEEVFRDEVTDGWSEKQYKYDLVYKYTITYQNQDGSTFQIGPCCGEEDNGERTKEFNVLVGKKDNNFFILTPPPYTP